MQRQENTILINGRFLMQPITGVQRVARELLSAMDRLVGAGQTQLQLSLACHSMADVESLGLRHITVERKGGAHGHLWEQLVLPRMVRGRQLLCLGNTVPVISALMGQRVAVMIHDVSYLSMPQAYTLKYRVAHRLLLPVIMRCADPIFTVSNVEKERLHRLVRRKHTPIIAIQNGAWNGDQVPLSLPNCVKRERMMLYVGSLSLRKNVERVFRVAETLAREDGVRTVFIGCQADILVPIRMSIAPDVKNMLDFVGQESRLHVLAEYYRRATCLLFPSLYEASPLPPLEAMSHGCPVVASAIPSLTERCGDAAIYCDPLDTQDMIAAVRSIFNNTDLANDLRNRGHEKVATYSWSRQAEQLLKAVTVS